MTRFFLLAVAALLAAAPPCRAQQIQSRAVGRGALPQLALQGELVRGTSDLSEVNGSDDLRSRLTIDPSFDAAPDSLLIFAVRQWNRFDAEMEWPTDG